MSQIFRNHLKTAVQTTNRKPQDVFLDTQEKFPNTAKSTGDLSYYKSMMYRARCKVLGGLPTDLSSLDAALVVEENKRWISFNPKKYLR